MAVAAVYDRLLVWTFWHVSNRRWIQVDCSLLIAHCSLLIAHCSFGHFGTFPTVVGFKSIAHCSLLIAHCSLLIAHCSLLIAHWEALGLVAAARLARVASVLRERTRLLR